METFVPDLILRTLSTYGVKSSKEVARVVIENRTGIDELNHAISLDNDKLREASIKTLRIVSEDAPELTYRFIYYYDFLLGSLEDILKWNATYIIANHARIDRSNRIDDQIVNKFINQLKDRNIKVAAHTASCIWLIAKYKPQYRQLIIGNLVKIDQLEREEEDNEILAGKTISALEELWTLADQKEEILEFVNHHINSSRPDTEKKAEQFVENHQKDIMTD